MTWLNAFEHFRGRFKSVRNEPDIPVKRQNVSPSRIEVLFVVVPVYRVISSMFFQNDRIWRIPEAFPIAQVPVTAVHDLFERLVPWLPRRTDERP